MILEVEFPTALFERIANEARRRGSTLGDMVLVLVNLALPEIEGKKVIARDD